MKTCQQAKKDADWLMQRKTYDDPVRERCRGTTSEMSDMIDDLVYWIHVKSNLV
jgi:hypothetical protein